MCGIVGYISKKDNVRISAKDKFLKEAIHVDTLRGSDSTGLMTVDEEMKWWYLKEAVSGPKFLSNPTYKKMRSANWAAIGHNRSATMGAVTVANAHPFLQQDILLVHNGTLRNVWQLPHTGERSWTDSEDIAHNLSKVTPENAGEIIQQLQGAFALVWMDLRDQSVNIVRNGDRPLHFGINKDEDLLLIASDGHMLNFLSNRMLDKSAQAVTIWQLGTYTHLKYHQGSLIPEVMNYKYKPPISPYRNIRQHQSPDYEKPFVTTDRRRFGVLSPHDIMLEEWYGMEPGSDEMAFYPSKWVQWGRSNRLGMCYGEIYYVEWQQYLPAVVHNVPRSLGSGIKVDSCWTVSPIGVSHSDGIPSESIKATSNNPTCFRVRVKWYSYLGVDPRTDAETKYDLKDDKNADLSNEELEGWERWLLDSYNNNCTYNGPRGKISLKAWNKLTDGGCVQCGSPLWEDDHDSITWVGEMENQPLCNNCLEDSTKLEDTVH